MKSNKPVYLIGDVHGYFSALLDIIENRDLRDCYLICVGDLGIGFKYGHTGEIQGMEYLNSEFAKREIIFMSIRGNHDDPFYWKRNAETKEPIVDFPYFKLLPDYTTMDINEEKFLFVGGGISIDRSVRRPGYSYWENEVFVLDESKIVECDVLVTHSGPNWIGPYDKIGIEGWCKRDPKLWDDCKKERDDHNKLYQLAKPKYAYLGHFHRFEAVESNGCYTTILDELQLAEYKPYGNTEEESETV